jgi:hypothetical protein
VIQSSVIAAQRYKIILPRRVKLDLGEFLRQAYELWIDSSIKWGIYVLSTIAGSGTFGLFPKFIHFLKGHFFHFFVCVIFDVLEPLFELFIDQRQTRFSV